MKLTIAQRLANTLLVCLLAILVIAGFAYRQMSEAQDNLSYINDNALASAKLLAKTEVYVERIRVNIRDYLITTDPAEKKAVDARMKDNLAKAESGLATYQAQFLSDDTDKQMLEAELNSLALYKKKLAELQSQIDANNLDAVRRELSTSGSFRAAAKQLTSELEAHVEYNDKLADALDAQNARDYKQALIIFAVIIVGSVLIAGGMGLKLLREIRHRMGLLRSRMMQVAADLDFTDRFHVTRMDELGMSADAFNKLLDTLQNNLQSVRAGAQTIASVSNALASTATQVASAAQHQSSASANMAATVEQMTVSVNHVADRANEANVASAESGRLAVEGKNTISRAASDINNISATVHSAADQIRGLEAKSQQVSQVVQVIKEVAEQTNLLALNAAIEAARAGEQGRGFAVVADEVRKLAERTSHSTEEIASTITAILEGAEVAVKAMEQVVQNVAEGVRGAEEANASITAIGDGSRKAVTLVDEITSAIKEQSVATTNIAQQVEGIAQMAEESSAAAGNTASSAKQLDELSRNLQGIVNAYKL